MMKKYESQRGAILVESAFIVGAIFLMLFGTVFIAIIGFDQMSADGASFEVAHQASLGVAAAPGAAHSAFPNIPPGQITTDPLPAPTSTIPVDYGYNSSDAATVAGSAKNRHGGVSMMQGTQIQGTATKTSASLLGSPISVMSTMVEPMWLENGLHFNAQNSNSYGGTTPVCAPTPASGSATPPPCFQGDVFTQGENTPPYFVGFNLMSHCQTQLPWGVNAGDTCDIGPAYTPLGVSEFLDHRNWCSSIATAPCTPVSNPGVAGSKQGDSTFATMSCHQRVYAALGAFFEANQNKSLQQINATQGGFTAISKGGMAHGPFYYYRDIAKSNSFKDWAGYDSSIAGETAATTVAYPLLGLNDKLVREVYNWDGNDISGPPAPTPLYPEAGC